MMRCVELIFFALSATSVASLQLTAKTFDEATAGKSVFIKFYAPWCGHCQEMQPAWEELMKDFADSKTSVVAEVDCDTEENQPLCEEHGVQGFPSLKHGDASALDDYEGARDLEAL